MKRFIIVVFLLFASSTFARDCGIANSGAWNFSWEYWAPWNDGFTTRLFIERNGVCDGNFTNFRVAFCLDPPETEVTLVERLTHENATINWRLRDQQNGNYILNYYSAEIKEVKEGGDGIYPRICMLQITMDRPCILTLQESPLAGIWCHYQNVNRWTGTTESLNIPSPDGACIVDNGLCLDAFSELFCMDGWEGEWVGDHTICEAGACHWNGWCYDDRTLAECNGPGTLVWLVNEDCPERELGNCKLNDECIIAYSRESCEILSGIWFGESDCTILQSYMEGSSDAINLSPSRAGSKNRPQCRDPDYEDQ